MTTAAPEVVGLVAAVLVAAGVGLALIVGRLLRCFFGD